MVEGNDRDVLAGPDAGGERGADFEGKFEFDPDGAGALEGGPAHEEEGLVRG